MMLLHILARGRIGRGPEADLVTRYSGRLNWPFKMTELPDKGGKIPPLAAGTARILLDEHGEQMTSMQLAELLGRWRDEGRRECGGWFQRRRAAERG